MDVVRGGYHAGWVDLGSKKNVNYWGRVDEFVGLAFNHVFKHSSSKEIYKFVKGSAHIKQRSFFKVHSKKKKIEWWTILISKDKLTNQQVSLQSLTNSKSNVDSYVEFSFAAYECSH